MLQPTCAAVEDEQAGLVPRMYRVLRDSIRREEVVEIVGTHALFVQEAQDHVQDKSEAEAEEERGGQRNEAADAGDLEPEITRQPADRQPDPAQAPNDSADHGQAEADQE
jgi:hypothetical protein